MLLCYYHIFILIQILHYKETLQFPSDVQLSDEAVDLIRNLMTDAMRRLGTRSVSDIKNHGFFRGIEWAEPPMIPEVLNDTDTRNFDHFDEIEQPEQQFYGQNGKGFPGGKGKSGDKQGTSQVEPNQAWNQAPRSSLRWLHVQASKRHHRHSRKHALNSGRLLQHFRIQLCYGIECPEVAADVIVVVVIITVIVIIESVIVTDTITCKHISDITNTIVSIATIAITADPAINTQDETLGITVVIIIVTATSSEVAILRTR
ncbi:MAG: hypothetical protein EZS28_040752 [Streblomastix strix]|uniref:AGC-kinase C-terminal domain-containing protein n=1 Tax=Streblomastix strix TaxID=222440 RepID=A0A5J4U184_9EUKA|nr:MAG: hypothetical protein EZS28_040752 [Streblomastix strix]